MRRGTPFLLVVLCICLLQACVQYENKRGVEVNWQSTVTDQLTRGESTREDVLALLGPPSQVISMDGETVMYYLFEHAKGQGMILIVYTRIRVNTEYDRAIFFFDENDILTEYSTRIYETDDS